MCSYLSLPLFVCMHVCVYISVYLFVVFLTAVTTKRGSSFLIILLPFCPSFYAVLNLKGFYLYVCFDLTWRRESAWGGWGVEFLLLDVPEKLVRYDGARNLTQLYYNGVLSLRCGLHRSCLSVSRSVVK